MAVTLVSGVQYSGIWTMQQVNAAIAAGTWPSAPAPHLYSWGGNASGQLGLGNTSNRSSPSQVGTATWSKVSAGSYNGFAIKPDGTLWSWGSNSSGALGLGNTTNYSAPIQVGSLTDWFIISGKSSNVLSIKTNGTLWSWGNNTYGQIGNSTTTNYSSPIQIGALTNWSTVSSGGSFSLAIKTDGTIWSWGRNTFGQLGLNVAGAGYSYSSPKQIGSLTNWASVSASPFGSVSAIKTDGTLWSWGGNNYGELGDGTITQRNSPVQIGALTNWMTVACGSYACIAIKTDGTLWTWGLGGNGQLGTGNTTSRSSPVQVGALTTWAYGSSSVQFFMGAVKTDGTLWTWGYNNQGQLGLSNNTYYSSPKQVGALTTWSTFSMGDSHTIAIATTV